MALVQPKTYNEVLRFHRCLELRNYVPEMNEDLFNRIFEFLNDPDHCIFVSNGLISFKNTDDSLVDIVNISKNTKQFNGIDLIFLAGTSLRVTRTYSGHVYGDGGSSSNNNNNNNNNNNG